MEFSSRSIPFTVCGMLPLAPFTFVCADSSGSPFFDSNFDLPEACFVSPRMPALFRKLLNKALRKVSGPVVSNNEEALFCSPPTITAQSPSSQQPFSPPAPPINIPINISKNISKNAPKHGPKKAKKVRFNLNAHPDATFTPPKPTCQPSKSILKPSTTPEWLPPPVVSARKTPTFSDIRKSNNHLPHKPYIVEELHHSIEVRVRFNSHGSSKTRSPKVEPQAFKVSKLSASEM